MWRKFKVPVISLISAAIGASGAVIYGQHAKKNDANSSSSVLTKNPWRSEDHFNSILKDQQKLFENFDNMFDDDFFRRDDPFEDMKAFRKRLMEQFLPERENSFSSPFDSWYENKFGGGKIEDVSKREDEKYVYYEIQVEGVDGTKVYTKVKDGYLTISGEVKRSQGSENDGQPHAIFQSSFQRTFPLPENVKSDKMEMVSEKNKIVLKFPKIRETE